MDIIKISKRMKELDEWFDEAVKRTNVHTTLESEFILYKGFKITKFYEDGNIIIQDTRFTDMYDDPKPADLKVIRKEGFIKGCSTLAYRRDLKRVQRYTRKVEGLYAKKKKQKSLSQTDKTTKAIKNAETNTKKFIDLIFFYQTKVNQYEQKYLNNE